MVTYERFTDRARKVMQLANQSAARLDRESIGPEHILAGLLLEGGGVAASVLKWMLGSIGPIQTALDAAMTPGTVSIVMGRLPHTPEAKRVIEQSIEAAREIADNYVGTEHLLLGLFRVPDTVAMSVLAKAGLMAETTRATLQELRAGWKKTESPSSAVGEMWQWKTTFRQKARVPTRRMTHDAATYWSDDPTLGG